MAKINKELFALTTLISQGLIYLLVIPMASFLILKQVYDQESLRSFSFYSNGAALIFVCLLAIIAIVIELHKKRESSTFFYIHKSKYNPILVAQISSVAFVFLYLIISPFASFAQNSAFPIIEQNVLVDIVSSETAGNFGRWLFTFSPVAFQETILIFAISSLVLLIVKNLFGKRLFNSSFSEKLIIILLIVAIWTSTGFLFHLAKYGAEQFLLFTGVMPFWFIGGLLTGVTESVFPAISQHIVNNGFLGAIAIFGIQTARIWAIVYIVVMAIVIFITYKTLEKRRMVILA